MGSFSILVATKVVDHHWREKRDTNKVSEYISKSDDIVYVKLLAQKERRQVDRTAQTLMSVSFAYAILVGAASVEFFLVYRLIRRIDISSTYIDVK
jgi:hypothetical protein